MREKGLMETEEMEMEMEIETEKEMEMETGKCRQRMRRRKCLVVKKAAWSTQFYLLTSCYLSFLAYNTRDISTLYVVLS